MASAKAGVHVVQLKPIAVPDLLRDGYKFIKWDDDSTIGTPVTMRVDGNGFFLFWTDQNNETEFLEISSIRDARTGRGARTPAREGKLRDSVSMGPEIPLEEKTVTIVYGCDFANVNYINFCCNNREVAQEWTDHVQKMAYNSLAANSSAYTFMMKSYQKLKLMSDSKGNIPVKNVIKMFVQHKDDKKRVDKALEANGLPSGKNDLISPDKMTFETFFYFRKHLAARTEVENIFNHLVGDDAATSHSHSSAHHHHPVSATSSVSAVVSSIGSTILNKQPSRHHQNQNKLMTVDQLVDFLNREQRDPRRNEILYPYADRAKGKEIIQTYEPSAANRSKDQLSVDGFLQYLMSDECAIVDIEKLDLNSDMDQPLNHYFINSSHNTYLSGHQLTGKSSVEMYRQALLAGCRCVELDCWNGRNSDEEPIITHGYTVVTEIVLKDVLEAIADSAFKTSDYPVVLSFENHCSPKQQAKIASYCHKIFGDMLLTEPLATNPLKPGVSLPSPKQLRRKIIIKNKKKHHVRRPRKARSPGSQQTSSEPPAEAQSTTSSAPTSTPERKALTIVSNFSEDSRVGAGSTGSHLEREDSGHLNDSDECPSVSVTGPAKAANPLSRTVTTAVSTSCDIEDVDSDSSADDETEVLSAEAVVSGDEVSVADVTNVEATAHIKETEAGAEMSALVLYIQPVRFHTFEYAEKKSRSYEISSFVETQATSLLKERPVDFVNFNKRQLSRIYPKGTRVDSSNYMPQVFWNAGCQMVALNFQTLDLGMQLNLGIFEYNGRSGYLLKPDFMRRADRLKFDPFTESTVDGIIAGTVAVKIISGQFLSDKRVGTYVEVDMFGLPADTARRRRTKTIPNNGLNPIFGDETFLFKKVVLPELACLRFAAYEDSGKFIGHHIVPVHGLRPGYRHVMLRNESGQPLLLPSLFVHVTVKDYVPEEFSDIADALANPIAYQSMAEKRAKQLEALTDDSEVSVHKSSAVASSASKAAASGSAAQTRVIVNPETPIRRQESKQQHVLSPSDEHASRDSDQPNEPTCQPAKQSSPAHHPPLLRQETFSMKINQSARSLSDEASTDRIPSLLESEEAHIIPEPLDKFREHKSVQKIFAKMEKEMQALVRKYEKTKEKELLLIHQKEGKIIQAQEKQKSSLAKSHSRLSRKSPTGESVPVASPPSPSDMQLNPPSTASPSISHTSGTSTTDSTPQSPSLGRRRPSLQFLVSSVPSLSRNLLKRRSDLDIQPSLEDQQQKLAELHRNYSEWAISLAKEEVMSEVCLLEKFHEQAYAAMDKAMLASQAAQTQSLQSLHDREVASLMKRLETQNKEDMAVLGKKHKDKNELARIKRELQQRLIDQAVCERQRFSSLLEKRKSELESRHEEARLKLQEDRIMHLSVKRREIEEKLQRIEREFSSPQPPPPP